MKTKKRWVMLGALAVVALAIYAGYVYSNAGIPSNNNNATHIVAKVEVIHFHITEQCYSCIMVGGYAQQTVDTYFANETASGKVIFMHVNGELQENRQMVEKYGATGSSLWLGIYDETGFHAHENINVWFKIENQAEYMDYLKGIIGETLEGNYTWISVQ